METNVLIITLDALRTNRVGAFGGRELTPNIDRLAADSTIFTNAYSTTNVTDVAVTSIQTGRYPLSHGVINHGTYVTKEEKNIVEQITQLPEVLSEAGYRTAKFGRPLGRWHRKGFDIYPSSMENKIAFDKKEQNLGITIKETVEDGLEQIHPQIHSVVSGIYNKIKSLPNNIDKSEIIKKYSDSSDQVIQNFEEFVNDTGVFYAFIHLMDSHTPYEANPELVSSYLDGFEYWTDVPMRGTGRHPKSFDKLIENGEYPQVQKKYYLSDGRPTTAITDAHYDASVTHSDRRVGQILKILKEHGEYDNTLIILLSDHGESLTEHGIYHDHHGLYDVSIQIPLIIRPPNGINKKITEFVQITDIAPTVESYTDTDGTNADGYSLRQVIEDDKSINRDYILAEEAHTQRRRMVRSKDTKLIYSLTGDTICRYCDVQHASEIELYDLAKDPNECNNIAKENQDIVEKYVRYGDDKAEELKNRKPDSNTDESITYEDEDKVKKRLEYLGYR